MKLISLFLVSIGCLFWGIKSAKVEASFVEFQFRHEFSSLAENPLGQPRFLFLGRCPIVHVLRNSTHAEILDPIVELICVSMIDLHSMRDVSEMPYPNSSVSIDATVNPNQHVFLGAVEIKSTFSSAFAIHHPMYFEMLEVMRRPYSPKQFPVSVIEAFPQELLARNFLAPATGRQYIFSSDVIHYSVVDDIVRSV